MFFMTPKLYGYERGLRATVTLLTLAVSHYTLCSDVIVSMGVNKKNSVCQIKVSNGDGAFTDSLTDFL